MRLCEKSGCERKHHARGLCNPCYVKWYRGKTPKPFRVKEPAPVKHCEVDGCTRKYVAKGFCQTHYERAKAGRDVYAPVRIVDPSRGCRAPECENVHQSNGLCGRHAVRFRKYGEDCLTLLEVCEVDSSHTGIMHVDHDHETGKVRGMLCGPCNAALGMARDNPDTLEGLAKYLRNRQ